MFVDINKKLYGKVKLPKGMIPFMHPSGIQFKPGDNTFWELKDRSGNMVYRKVTREYAAHRIKNFNKKNNLADYYCFGLKFNEENLCPKCAVKNECKKRMFKKGN